MGLLVEDLDVEFEGVVAALVGGLRFDWAAEFGVGGEVVVLWCRRRCRVIGDVIVRGARNSRTAGWPWASDRGERSLADMVVAALLCWFWVQWLDNSEVNGEVKVESK